MVAIRRSAYAGCHPSGAPLPRIVVAILRAPTRRCPPLGAPFFLLRSNIPARAYARSEEQTSELQSLMRISSPVFCVKTTKPRQPCADRAEHGYTELSRHAT